MASNVRPARGATALVAKHNTARRELIVEALRSEGFEVSEARDAVEFIERIHADASEWGAPPDVIVAESRLPGVDSVGALLGDCLDRAELARTRLILLRPLDARAGIVTRADGAVVVLEGPYEMDDLRRLVTQAVTALGPLRVAPPGPRRTSPCFAIARAGLCG